MKKAIIILLTALVALSVFVSCNQDNILDEEFNKYVTVTFDSNNGSGATATQTIMKKTPTALDANGFKYAEHAFVCWNRWLKIGVLVRMPTSSLLIRAMAVATITSL